MIVFFNGNFIEKEKVHISPDDRGFLYADGVYEVIRSYHGKIFMLREHLDRLKYSIGELKINFQDVYGIGEILQKLTSLNQLEKDDITFYIQITRGVYQRKLKFPPESVTPTVYICPNPVDPDLVAYQKGVKAITVEDIRWGRCDIKTVGLLPNALAQQQAAEAGCQIALFVKNGHITEGTHVGVFGIKDGKLLTHPGGKAILPSITRGVVTGLCKKLNIEIIEKPVEHSKVYELDELFIAGTTPEITPVLELDGKKIQNGLPGLLTMKLQNAFKELIVC